MNNTLFWRLSGTISLVTVALFSLINYLTDETERHMSFIKIEHQRQLSDYAKQAQQLYLDGDKQALKEWLQVLQQKENTWVAILESSIDPILGTHMEKEYLDGFLLGRGIDWKIHLYFDYNPVMEVPFVDKSTHFLIRLPERMRPGTYWRHMDLLLQVALPLLPLLLLTWLIYRHLMSPLQRLGNATRKFSEGDHKVRVRPSLGSRRDELTDLADAFDQMAENTGKLIIKQRQLIADLSHELRTPITRMEMAIGAAKQGIAQKKLILRLEKETTEIRSLIEDTLTLAWLENEKPKLSGDTFDLIELIDIIIEDAEFEFPDAILVKNLPDKLTLKNCSQRALAPALENLIRNALKYSPMGKEVTIKVDNNELEAYIWVSDQGIGVPDALLDSIFQPFFRVDKSRDKKPNGFGLGLALARRQVEAISGSLSARNINSGLEMQIKLPLK
jgi:two-component system sensor histidine kinase PfeS